MKKTITNYANQKHHLRISMSGKKCALQFQVQTQRTNVR